MGNLLLFRLGGLGDLLVVLPAIALAGRVRGADRLTLVCRPEYGLLLRDAGLVDTLIDVGGREAARFFRAAPSWTAEARAELARCDGVIAWLQKAAEFPPVDVALGAGSRTARAIFPPADLQAPLSRFFFDETAVMLGVAANARPSFDVLARLPVAPACRRAAPGSFGLGEAGGGSARYAVLHPGSGSASKCWPLQRFLRVARGLGAAGVRGVVVTGDADRRLAGELESAELPPGWTRRAQPPLSELAGLLAGAAVYVGNDSGVTHLAAACGAPVVAVFRSENVRLWRPAGRVRLIDAPDLDEISAERVLEAAMNSAAGA